MNLPDYVKPLPKFFSRFSYKGFTIIFLKKIFLRREIFDNLNSTNPSVTNISILKHEEVHLRRGGKLKSLRYLISKLRLEEELIAYKEQFKFLKKHKEVYDLENVAKHLPGLNYEKAKKVINKTWEDA